MLSLEFIRITKFLFIESEIKWNGTRIIHCNYCKCQVFFMIYVRCKWVISSTRTDSSCLPYSLALVNVKAAGQHAHN